MSYQHKHIQIKTPQDGYNLIADQYGKYHEHLNSFDKGFFLRLLPRNLEQAKIIDIGAGDGRIYKLLKDYNFQEYCACDISEKLLKKHPGSQKVKKIVCNLEKTLPFQDDEYDTALAFFVLEHIDNIEGLFQEIYRILKPGGQRIIGHFLQRREFLRKTNNNNFRIKMFNHRIQDIQKIAQDTFFDLDIFPINENSNTIGWILSLRKN